MLTLLFDLDGTLVDTDPLHFRAHAMLLAENGLPEIDLNFYRTHIMGFGMAEMSALYAQWIPGGNEARYRAMADRKEALFRELISEVEPARGVVHLLDWAGEKGVPCGVVTNAPRENAKLVLRALGIEDRFDTIVLGEELAHAKPHPLPYLTALEQLRSPAEAAIAFEDSISGVRAATSAGIRTMGVRSALSEQVLRGAGASHVIDDFRDDHLWSELYRQIGERSVQADA